MTAIEALAGRTELAAGKISRGHNVKLGYLSQHAEELGELAAAVDARLASEGGEA